MNHSNIGHSDEVTLAVRMPEIMLYLTTNRMLLGKGVNKSLEIITHCNASQFSHFSKRKCKNHDNQVNHNNHISGCQR